MAKAVVPWLEVLQLCHRHCNLWSGFGCLEQALRHQGQIGQWWALGDGRCCCQQRQGCLQWMQVAAGRRAVPFSWQTVFSWSCRVPVSVGEDLAPCHSRSWYMGILPSFLSALPSLDITCVGGGKRRGGTWGKCEKWVKLSESRRYSPRLIPPVGKGVDFWIPACVIHVYYFYAGSNWNT